MRSATPHDSKNVSSRTEGYSALAKRRISLSPARMTAACGAQRGAGGGAGQVCRGGVGGMGATSELSSCAGAGRLLLPASANACCARCCCGWVVCASQPCSSRLIHSPPACCPLKHNSAHVYRLPPPLAAPPAQRSTRLGVGPVAQPIHKPRRNSHDVLQRAAALGPHHVVHQGHIEVGGLKQVLGAPGGRCAVRA